MHQMGVLFSMQKNLNRMDNWVKKNFHGAKQGEMWSPAAEEE